MKFLKNLGITWSLFTFFSILLLSVILMIATFSIVAKYNQHDEEYLGYVTGLRLLSQQITQHASRAAVGDTVGFDKLSQAQIEFQNLIEKLQNGNPETGMPSTPEPATVALTTLSNLWTKAPTTNMNLSIQNLLDTQEAVIPLYNEVTKLQTVTDDLVEKTEQMINAMTSSEEVTVNQIVLASRQLMWLERIKQNIRRSFIIKNSEEAMGAEGQLNEAISQLTEALAILSGSDTEESEQTSEQISPVLSPLVQQTITELETLFNERIDQIDFFLEKSEALYKAKDALQVIMELNPLILDNIEQLQTDYINAGQQRLISPKLGYALAALVLFLFIISILLIIRTNHAYSKETNQRFNEAQQDQKRNQEAILRLLNEIADLADGDLTVTATVTEDFTGAIADAINFSVEALRDLVVSINNTAMQVTEEAQKTRGTAVQLTQASERQAQQIAKAGQAIIGMANAVKKVSANAVESADVANQSVDIASKGATVVRDTIVGMENIREQIQETSKRIKRLGESAQEIGEIVGLIDDIADQTNILALNAAIQAAMAGEAGRGFAVVADEIQRLAERSGNATRQIDALVRTIQGDTNEAVSSMEQSTSGVVSVATVAERAGDALTEIEQVSVQLAGRIENISQTSRTQAAVAANISNTMTVIQDITNQQQNGVNETAISIEHLAERANELKKSVTGFKLPTDTQSNDEVNE